MRMPLLSYFLIAPNAVNFASESRYSNYVRYSGRAIDDTKATPGSTTFPGLFVANSNLLLSPTRLLAGRQVHP